MREPDEADGVILDVQAAVVGEGTFDAKFVKTDFEQWREDAQELPVRFAINCKRSEHAHWPNPTDIGPVPQQCPSCGLGTDDNGDGDCAVCGPKKVSR